MTYPQNFNFFWILNQNEYNLKTFACKCNTIWITKKVGNTKRKKLIPSEKKTSEICKEKIKFSFVTNLKARLPLTILGLKGILD